MGFLGACFERAGGKLPYTCLKLITINENLSYWCKFHVDIITGSGVLTILFNKGLTGNPQLGNTPMSFAQYLETEASKGYDECF